MMAQIEIFVLTGLLTFVIVDRTRLGDILKQKRKRIIPRLMLVAMLIWCTMVAGTVAISATPLPAWLVSLVKIDPWIVSIIMGIIGVLNIGTIVSTTWEKQRRIKDLELRLVMSFMPNDQSSLNLSKYWDDYEVDPASRSAMLEWLQTGTLIVDSNTIEFKVVKNRNNEVFVHFVITPRDDIHEEQHEQSNLNQSMAALHAAAARILKSH